MKENSEMFPKPEFERFYTVMVVSMAYNHASYIEDALKGIVMQQTKFSVVVCVLDDCSTDGTADIIRKYEKEYPELIKGFYFKENQYSQGKRTFYKLLPWLDSVKYIALCEGDDYWTDPLKLQKQVDFMEKHCECSLCFHNALIHYQDGSRTDKLFRELEERYYTGEEVYENWTVPSASVLIRSSILRFEEIKKRYDKRMAGFDIVIILVCSLFGRLYCIPDVMSVYRVTKGGQTQSLTSNVKEGKDINLRMTFHNLAMIEKFGDSYKSIAESHFYSLCLRSILINIKKLQLVWAGKFLSIICQYSFMGFCKYILKNVWNRIKQ